MMSLFRLAWSSKVQLPLLITVCFMAFDIRLQIEINIFWDQANHRRRGEEGDDVDGDGHGPGRVRPVLGVAPLALAEQALLGIDTSDEDDDEDDEDESDTDTEDTDEDEDKDKKKKDKKKDDDGDDEGGKGQPGESSGRSNPSSSSGQGDGGGGGAAGGPRDRDRDDDDEGRDLSLVLQVELHHGHGARYSDSDIVELPPTDIYEHFDYSRFFPKAGMANAKIQTTTVPLNILQKYLEKKTLVTTMADKWKLTSGRSGSTLRDLFV